MVPCLALSGGDLRFYGLCMECVNVTYVCIRCESVFVLGAHLERFKAMDDKHIWV